jgi:hypothetical protein
MTDIQALSNEVAIDAQPKPRQATGGRARLIVLMLVCLTAMAGWLGFLGWGSGHLFGIW